MPQSWLDDLGEEEAAPVQTEATDANWLDSVGAEEHVAPPTTDTRNGSDLQVPDYLRAPPEEQGRRGVLGAGMAGLETAKEALQAAFNTYTADPRDVEASAARMQAIEKTPEQIRFGEAIRQSKEVGDDTLWQGVKNVVGAAWDEPVGALHEIVAQTPNSGVVLGGMYAGGKGGAVLGTMTGIPAAIPILTVVGGIVGMVFGNTAIETGHMAIEKAEDGYTDVERLEAINEGLAKGSTIAAIDTATLGMNRWLLGGPGRVVERAVTNDLKRQGVDVASREAVDAALKSPEILKSAIDAGTTALNGATTTAKRAGRGVSGFTLETIGEGVGEYTGELAAGHEASYTEAAMESLMAAPQSVTELYVSKRLTQAGENTQALTRAQEPSEPPPADTGPLDAIDILGEEETTPPGAGAPDPRAVAETGEAQVGAPSEAPPPATPTDETAPDASEAVSGIVPTPIEEADIQMSRPDEPLIAGEYVPGPEEKITYFDDRLNRKNYRDALQSMGDELQTQGGIALYPDPDYKKGESDKPGEIPMKRHGSLNPDWYQELQKDPSYQLKGGAKGVWEAVEKALKGERLGVRQQRVLGAFLDIEQEGRNSPENLQAAREELWRARDARTAAGMPDAPDWLFEEPDYPDEATGLGRTFMELQDHAASLSPELAEQVMGLMEKDAPDADILAAITQLFEAEHGRTIDTSREGYPEPQAEAGLPGAGSVPLPGEYSPAGELYGEPAGVRPAEPAPAPEPEQVAPEPEPAAEPEPEPEPEPKPEKKSPGKKERLIPQHAAAFGYGNEDSDQHPKHPNWKLDEKEDIVVSKNRHGTPMEHALLGTGKNGKWGFAYGWSEKAGGGGYGLFTKFTKAYDTREEAVAALLRKIQGEAPAVVHERFKSALIPAEKPPTKKAPGKKKPPPDNPQIEKDLDELEAATFRLDKPEGEVVPDEQKEKEDQGDLLEAAANEAATSPKNDEPLPTEAQKEAGNYKKGHYTISGLDITIENPAGSIREGESEDGKAWSQKMANHYGYIKKTVGAEGDHVDIFLADNAADAGTAFVIDQINPTTKEFDEHKVVLGPHNQEAAHALYQANYEKGWQGAGAITEMDLDELKEWLKGDTTKALLYKEPKKKPAPKKPAAKKPGRDAKIEDFAKPLNKITITQDVVVEETGETATIKVPADEALSDIDNRLSVLEQLKECIRA